MANYNELEDQQVTYLKRNTFLFLTRVDRSTGIYFFVGALLLVFGGWFYVQSKVTTNPFEYVFIVCYSLLFLIFAYYSFEVAMVKDARPKSPHVYSPLKVYKERRFNLLMITFCACLFFGPFIISPEMKSNQRLVCSLFLLAAFGWICYHFYNQHKKYIAAKDIGDAMIEVVNEPIQKGGRCTIYFKNEVLYKKVNELQVHLRNIKEIWIKEKEVKRKGEKKDYHWRKSILLYEDQKTISVDSALTTLEFDIPLVRGQVTDYMMKSPCYWELEVSHEQSGYYSRFFIEVV